MDDADRCCFYYWFCMLEAPAIKSILLLRALIFLFLQVIDQLESVCCGQTPDGSGTVDGNDHGAITIQQETGGMQKILLLFVKSAGQIGDILRLDSERNREGQLQTADGLDRVFVGIDRGRQQSCVALFEGLEIVLKISQLLMTERSPVPAVEKNKTPLSGKLFGQNQSSAGGCREVKFRKAVTGVEPVLFRPCHGQFLHVSLPG